MTRRILDNARIQLIDTARSFYQQGWMVGTAGNLSIRLPDGSFWITASGKSKGELLTSDFVRVYPDGILEKASADLQPSAETAIHQIIYTLFPETQACYHVHSVESNLVSRFTLEDNILLPPLEMLKGLGVYQENPCCFLPIFANHLQVARIAADIQQRFTANSVQIPALLIRDHGVTTWASSPTAARNYIEILEYIFRYIVTERMISSTGKGNK